MARRVAPDLHVEVDGRYYSVPHALINQALDVGLIRFVVEIFHEQERVAAHTRAEKRGGFTAAAHLQTPQQFYLQEWTPGRFLSWAVGIGPHTRDLVWVILESFKARGRVIEAADDAPRMRAIAREFATSWSRQGEAPVISRRTRSASS